MAFSNSELPKPGEKGVNAEKNLELWHTSGFSMTLCLVHLVCLCGTTLWTKVPKFVIWLTFKNRAPGDERHQVSKSKLSWPFLNPSYTSIFHICLHQSVEAQQVAKHLIQETYSLALAVMRLGFVIWPRILVYPYVFFGVGQPNQESTWATPDYIRVACELAVTSSDLTSVCPKGVSAKAIYDLCERLEDVTRGAKW